MPNLRNSATTPRIRAVTEVETIGARIKRERLDRSWTQRQLADKVGVGVPHISKVEADRESPSDALLERLAQVFEIDPAELFIVARRLPGEIVDSFAVDPVKAVSFLRTWKAPRQR